MSRAIRIVITVILACICQTDLVKYIRIAGVAPDMMTVFLVLLTGYTGVLRRQRYGIALRRQRWICIGHQSGLLYVYWLGCSDAAACDE